MSPSQDGPPPLAAPPGKIAMKGFSLSAKASSSTSTRTSKSKPASHLGKSTRGGFPPYGDSGSESEDGLGSGIHEAVTGFGTEGAIRSDREGSGNGNGNGRRGGELVIQKMANRDWRAEARARGSGRDLLPSEARAQRDAAVVGRGRAGNGGKEEGIDVVNGNDGATQWGLSVRKQARTADGNGEAHGDAEGGEKGVESSAANTLNQQEDKAAQTSKPQTADEEALASLLGQPTSQSQPSILTIPIPFSELEAYKAAVASAPDPSTLEDYERIPVEEFGAALLRGMGWKGEKNAAKRQPKDVKRRQNLLGLGAKELDGAEELGAWVQKSDVKRLNPGGVGKRSGGSGGGGGGGRLKAGEYKREKERERERREERGGGGYRREREREQERERDGGHRKRDGHGGHRR